MSDAYMIIRDVSTDISVRDQDITEHVVLHLREQAPRLDGAADRVDLLTKGGAA